jgi:hypothetical protein
MMGLIVSASIAAADNTGSDETTATRINGETTNTMSLIFPIGVWFDGRVEGINCGPGYHNVPKDREAARKYYESNFRDIRKHGIEIVVIPNTPPAYRPILLAAADKIGVKIVLEIVELAYPDFGKEFSVRNPKMTRDEAKLTSFCASIIAPLKTHPSLLCYQVLDEPPAELFENFSRVSRVLTKLDPDHPSFSCLCREEELPRTSTMGTQMIVFDRYPLRKPSRPGDYDFEPFRKLLDTLDSHAKSLPYWMAVQTFAMDRPDGCRYPSSAELREMVWLSLAHNCKGIFFFLQNSYTQGEKMLGLIGKDMKPHPIYSEVAEIAARLKKLRPALLKLSRTDSPLAAQNGFDVQGFTDATGSRFVIVVNRDVLKPNDFRAKLQGGKSAVDLEQTHDIANASAADGAKEISLKLSAGDGALLQIK